MSSGVIFSTVPISAKGPILRWSRMAHCAGHDLEEKGESKKDSTLVDHFGGLVVKEH